MNTFHVAFSANLVRPNGELIIPREELERLNEIPGLAYEFLSERTPTVTAEQITNVNAFIQDGLIVDGATFSDGAGDLTFICLFSLGYDTVDLAACTAAGVAVTRNRGISKHTVASGALLLILALSKRLVDKQRLARQGRWDLNRSFWGHDIQNKVLGIVGLGDIGRELVRLIEPFDMHVIASDPYIEPEVFQKLGVENTNLDDLLEQSDFVSLHCSLTPETQGLIGQRELHLMRPTAHMINTARGPVVNQGALTQALTEQWIAGAGIDVFEVEPLPIDDPLIQLDNVILTPHTIGASHESVQRGSEMIVSQIEKAARGEIPPHVLNPEVMDSSSFQGKLQRIRRRL